MKRKQLFFLCLVTVLMFTSCNDSETELPALVLEGEERKVMFREVFTDCEHGGVLREESRSSLETEKDLLKTYPEFNIIDFEETHATLIQYREGKCAEHYLFKEYKGKIGVFRENNGALLDVLDVSVEELRKQDRNMLKDGVSVFGKEECAAFWDDFGS